MISSENKSSASPFLAAAGLQITAIDLSQMPENRNAPFLQQAFWGEYKSGFGWHPHAFRLEWPADPVSPRNSQSTCMLVLERQLGLGVSIAYIPHGPEQGLIDGLSQVAGCSAGEMLSGIAKRLTVQFGHKPICVRFDLDWVIARRPAIDQQNQAESESTNQFTSINHRENFRLPPLKKALADIQPPDTVLIDLRQGSEQVLAGMKAKTRYNVRLAEKKGVVVEAAGLSRLVDWYRMYCETAIRDQIAVHSQTYYHSLLSQNADKMELLLASHEEDLLAGIIVLYSGNRATYLYGASSNHKRNLMPTYLLQWVAISRAIDRGCKEYDCFGIPPSAAPGHPMHGLYQFKTGFGGEVIAYPGCWDVPIRPIYYYLYGLAEKLRQLWYKRLKKR